MPYTDRELVQGLGGDQGIGTGWARGAQGMFGGGDPGAYEDALVKGATAGKYKADTALALEKAATLANARVAGERIKANYKALGFSDEEAQMASDLTLFGGARTNADQAMGAFGKARSYRIGDQIIDASRQEGLSEVESLNRGQVGSGPTTFSQGVGEGRLIIDPTRFGGAPQETVINTSKEAVERSMEAENYQQGAAATTRAAKAGTGGGSGGTSPQAQANHYRTFVRPETGTTAMQAAAAAHRDGYFDAAWAISPPDPAYAKTDTPWGPPPTQIPGPGMGAPPPPAPAAKALAGAPAPKAAPVPADPNAPVPGARRGKNPQGKAGWYVQQKDGNWYEVTP